MFWNNPGWQGLDRPQAVRALAQLSKLLRPAYAMTFCTRHGSAALKDGDIAILGVRLIELAFYWPRPHWLYELELDLDDNGLAKHYESAHLFVVVGPSDKLANELLPAPHTATNHAAYAATLLDWTSAPLHRLNEQNGFRIFENGACDRVRAITYLDFFTSFLGGTRTPFLLLRGGTLERPDGIALREGSETFEQRLSTLVHGTFQLPMLKMDPYRGDPPPDDRADRGGPNTDGSAAGAVSATQPSSDRTANGKNAGRDEVENGGSENDRGENDKAPAPATKPVPASSRRAESISPSGTIRDVRVKLEDVDKRILRLDAIILYEEDYFEATFDLADRDGTLNVEMVSDLPLQVPVPPFAHYRVDKLGEIRIPLLVRPRAREEVSAREFLDRLALAMRGSHPWADSLPQLETLRVFGQVDLRGVCHDRRLWLRDIEFLHSVVLEDARRVASLKLESCKIAQRIAANNLALEGDLILDQVTVLDAEFWNADEPPGGLSATICLDGARISGSFDAQRLTVLGCVSAVNAVIHGAARLHGLTVRQRSKDSRPALRFDDATVTAGFYLDPAEERRPFEETRHRRSLLFGDLRLRGLKTSEVLLRGALGHNLDLSYACLDGLLDLSTHVDSWDGATGRCFRTWLASMDLRSLQVAELRLGGAYIGELSLVQARVAGSIFAVPDPGFSPYRTEVRGNVVLSAATIGGVCQFNGSKISGELQMLAGMASRIDLSFNPLLCGHAAEPDNCMLDYLPCEVGAIGLVGVSGLKQLNCVGVEVAGLHHRSEQFSAVFLAHFQVQGDVLFHWSVSLTALFEEVWRAVMARPSTQNDASSPVSNTSIRWRRDDPRLTCRTRVAGSLELRRVTTSGKLDLTNVELEGGTLILRDAHIGTNLVARSSPLRGQAFRDSDTTAPRLVLKANGADLDGTCIEGHAWLSGLDLTARSPHEGHLRGRGLRVGGKLEFALDGDRHARIGGRLQLGGLQAAQLLLADASLPAGASPNGPPWIDLGQSKIGALTFFQDPKRPQGELIDLTGATVSNWVGCHDATGHLGILNRIKMNRAVWLAAEAKLRNESRAGDADAIYREMMRREPARGPWRRLGKTANDWLWGFGTEWWRAVVVAFALSLVLLGVLAQRANVRATASLLGQLHAQCGPRVETAPSPGGPYTLISSSPQPRCVAYVYALGHAQPSSERWSTLQLSPSELAVDDYDGFSALRLTLRYALPGVGAFGDSDWAPQSLRGTQLGPLDTRELPITPETLATVIRLINTVLLAFAVAFITRRWLR